MRILLAEDNPTNQMVAVEMLRALGAGVTLAQDGAEALDIAAREAFDLILVDIEMPRISGIEVIRRIRAGEHPQCDTPVVALTAYVMREHRELIRAAGADGIIPKPIVSIDQFGSDILDMLSERRGRSADGDPEQAHLSAPAGGAGENQIVENVYDALADAIGPDAMEELLRRVCEDLGNAGDQVHRGLRAANDDAVRAGTHIIISVAGAVGAVSLQRAAQALNAAAGASDRATLDRDGPLMIAQIDSVRRQVEARQSRSRSATA